MHEGNIKIECVPTFNNNSTGCLCFVQWNALKI